MTVAELVLWLQEKAQPSDTVVVSWEGTTNSFSLYPGATGVVVIDADNDHYRETLQGRLSGEHDNVWRVQERMAKEQA